ncbi:MAG: ADP-ribosylglycohydrolase family protein [Clostridia bacterium]|nr:ADP-ribosylglycohydrolase family protein [Clostridia bacterium]
MDRYDIVYFTGCLVGGAIGDALGYPVEFMKVDEILAEYGEDGITDFSDIKGDVHISDDTQMTLFTANGLLCAVTAGKGSGVASYIYSAYIDWLRTQRVDTDLDVESVSWLRNVDALNAQRSPGNTCLSVLSAGKHGSVGNPVNNSKGCGGIMRVSPIGLLMDDENDVAACAAGAAAITHGNPLGFVPAAAYALIINNIINTDNDLIDCVADAVRFTADTFRNMPAPAMKRFLRLMTMAIGLAADNRGKRFSVEEEAEIISRLGAGWVAEETLAIGVYCALAHQDDFAGAVSAAVNHSGDSDSTGAVTGGILGALFGIEQLPMKFVTQLELYDVITEISQDLFSATQPDAEGLVKTNTWKEKYSDHTYS